MPEVFNKTGHGLTDIVIAWDEFKAVSHPEFFWGNKGNYIYCVLEWNWRLSTMVGACVKYFFWSLEWLRYVKTQLLSWLKTVYKPCSKKSGLSIWVPHWFINMNIQHCKFQEPDCYDFRAMTFSNYITHILGKL